VQLRTEKVQLRNKEEQDALGQGKHG